MEWWVFTSCRLTVAIVAIVASLASEASVESVAIVAEQYEASCRCRCRSLFIDAVVCSCRSVCRLHWQHCFNIAPATQNARGLVYSPYTTLRAFFTMHTSIYLVIYAFLCSTVMQIPKCIHYKIKCKYHQYQIFQFFVLKMQYKYSNNRSL